MNNKIITFETSPLEKVSSTQIRFTKKKISTEDSGEVIVEVESLLKELKFLESAIVQTQLQLALETDRIQNDINNLKRQKSKIEELIKEAEELGIKTSTKPGEDNA